MQVAISNSDGGGVVALYLATSGYRYMNAEFLGVDLPSLFMFWLARLVL